MKSFLERLDARRGNVAQTLELYTEFCMAAEQGAHADPRFMTEIIVLYKRGDLPITFIQLISADLVQMLPSLLDEPDLSAEKDMFSLLFEAVLQGGCAQILRNCVEFLAFVLALPPSNAFAKVVWSSLDNSTRGAGCRIVDMLEHCAKSIVMLQPRDLCEQDVALWTYVYFIILVRGECALSQGEDAAEMATLCVRLNSCVVDVIAYLNAIGADTGLLNEMMDQLEASNADAVLAPFTAIVQKLQDPALEMIIPIQRMLTTRAHCLRTLGQLIGCQPDHDERAKHALGNSSISSIQKENAAVCDDSVAAYLDPGHSLHNLNELVSVAGMSSSESKVSPVLLNLSVSHMREDATEGQL